MSRYLPFATVDRRNGKRRPRFPISYSPWPEAKRKRSLELRTSDGYTDFFGSGEDQLCAVRLENMDRARFLDFFFNRHIEVVAGVGYRGQTTENNGPIFANIFFLVRSPSITLAARLRILSSRVTVNPPRRVVYTVNVPRETIRRNATIIHPLMPFAYVSFPTSSENVRSSPQHHHVRHCSKIRPFR